MRVVALALFSLLTGVGCGGSSSETPPPLEPDPTSALYTGPRFPEADNTPAPSPAAEPDEDDLPKTPRRPAAGTWGTGKAAPSKPVAAPAPTMTSPTALPLPSASSAPTTPPKK